MQNSQTVTIDGKTYKLEDLSPNIRQAVGIYNTLNQDLQKEQLAVVKTQAALQHIGNQISAAVQQEEEQKENGREHGDEDGDVETPEPAPRQVPEDPVGEEDGDFRDPIPGQRRRY